MPLLSSLPWVAIAAGVVAYMVIGFAWYSPMLFVQPWMKMNGLPHKHASKQDMQRGMIKALLVSLACSIVMSTVIALVLQMAPAFATPSGALAITGLLWLGTVFATFATSYAYLQKPFALLLIDTGYPLCGMLAMASLQVLLR
jgi:sterol desaturase/sphingolipid hydroxylase (fatty acid hydroxylase superfamily)